jgi:hypothetical protein
LTAHSAADTLVRVFNHGVVAVNPSMEPQTVSLSGRSVQVPALDAVFVPR